jgi:predicted HTH domain antitoxin
VKCGSLPRQIDEAQGHAVGPNIKLTSPRVNNIMFLTFREDLMKVTVEFPDSLALYCSQYRIEDEIKLNMALMLVKQGKISVSRGSELAGLDLYAFLYECKKNEIPVLDFSMEHSLPE